MKTIELTPEEANLLKSILEIELLWGLDAYTHSELEKLESIKAKFKE